MKLKLRHVILIAVGATALAIVPAVAPVFGDADGANSGPIAVAIADEVEPTDPPTTTPPTTTPPTTTPPTTTPPTTTPPTTTPPTTKPPVTNPPTTPPAVKPPAGGSQVVPDQTQPPSNTTTRKPRSKASASTAATTEESAPVTEEIIPVPVTPIAPSTTTSLEPSESDTSDGATAAKGAGEIKAAPKSDSFPMPLIGGGVLAALALAGAIYFAYRRQQQSAVPAKAGAGVATDIESETGGFEAAKQRFLTLDAGDAQSAKTSLVGVTAAATSVLDRPTGSHAPYRDPAFAELGSTVGTEPVLEHPALDLERSITVGMLEDPTEARERILEAGSIVAMGSQTSTEVGIVSGRNPITPPDLSGPSTMSFDAPLVASLDALTDGDGSIPVAPIPTRASVLPPEITATDDLLDGMIAAGALATDALSGGSPAASPEEYLSPDSENLQYAATEVSAIPAFSEEAFGLQVDGLENLIAEAEALHAGTSAGDYLPMTVSEFVLPAPLGAVEISVVQIADLGQDADAVSLGIITGLE